MTDKIPMLALPGPVALSPFRISSLQSTLNTAVNSNAITAIASIYVHYIAVSSENSPLFVSSSHERQLLETLLKYDNPPDPNDPLQSLLVTSAQDTHFSHTEADSYLVRVIPRPGTTSPWSSKATNIAVVCGLGDQLSRIERGLIYLIQVRKGFPFSSYLESPAFLDLLYDRMTQKLFLSTAPSASDLFQVSSPKPLIQIPLGKSPQTVLEDANTRLGLALAPPEIAYLAEAFANSDKALTDAELFMFAQVNSEHCRHKIFNADWKIDGDSKPHSLFSMIRNTHQLNPKYTVSAYSDNAAVIEGTGPSSYFFYNSESHLWQRRKEDVLFVAKVETHNHPTAVSPFAGAATGSGGEIRDEGAVGRGSKPKAGLAGFTVSDLLIPDHHMPWEIDVGKPMHISSALDIMLKAPIGSASFSNEFGRPCITGYFRTLTTTVPISNSKSEIRGYHKPIMIAGGLGTVRPMNALKNATVPPGSKLIVLGGPAMLIGLGGGAASSVASGDAAAELDFASVQRENAEMERRAQEVIDSCASMGDENIILSVHDVGAGGLSNAFPELVHDNGLGAVFEIRDVPCADPSMSPMEIWCCEAQERYVLAVSPENVDRFIAICKRESCTYGVVGTATEEERLVVTDRLLKDNVVDIDMSTLFGKPPKLSLVSNTRKPKIPAFNETLTPYINSTELSEKLYDAVNRVLKLPAVGSKSFLITIGDRSVSGLVARDQMVGPWQVPVSDVGVTMSSLGSSTVGECMAMGERPSLALVSPKASACMAVAESITNLVAANIPDLSTVKLSANWMSAAHHEGEGAGLYEAVEAIGMHLCPALGISIPVGKDSLSMKMRWEDTTNKENKEVISPLTLIITAFSSVVNTSATWTPQLIRDTTYSESTLFFIDLADGNTRLGGSALAQVYKQVGDSVPDVVDAGLLKSFVASTRTLHDNDIVLAYHDRSDGGLITTLLEMAFAGRVGLEIELPETIKSTGDVIKYLFNEELGAVFQVKNHKVTDFMNAFRTNGIPESIIQPIAKLSKDKNQPIAIYTSDKAKIFGSTRADLQQAWALTSYKMQRLRDNPKTADQEYMAITDDSDPGLFYRLSFDITENLIPNPVTSRPKVAILREQGVNGQMEMAYAFSAAGFDAIDVHMTDILRGHVTLDEFVGLAACGGFSYGDVLGAGNGWAKSVLYHPEIRKEFERFFTERTDTFALGVCNGCQFLSRIREIIPGTEDWPTFERNISEQYEARVCMVEIVEEAKTPNVFLHGMWGSKLPVVVAHGEGRAQFSDTSKLKSLTSSGGVGLRFVDNYGKVTEKYPFNPNGSPSGIAGVRSVNGRVFALMPHPERIFLKEANSWYPKEEGTEWGQYGPWMRMFMSARRWVGA
ncbi:hypothetical protein CANCADRAFT_30462 [Tortispora caseinolytica NRRL Y-17796]|uniref:Phosphoribosylformylglycinamidine synthase n=1 Tax=Tortispora caseinolytica NRRL Y-17796 TaxID=767744 RepID=A0A1E4TKF4_9ASCO|nr:hypothetical protein CANCADRAFT_30462 [Tortispora caseinolytica NRRL Y-17796]